MLGARIAGLRREAGFSQAELADRLDKLPKWVNISREREEEQKRNNARE